MANGWGGYRQPANPAAVSGPGGLSARTDGAMGGALNPNSPSYGEGVDLQSIKQAAPMASASSPAAPQAQGADPLSALVGLGAPSTQPNVPVTDGAAAGAGRGLGALGLPMSDADMKRADVRALGPGAVQAMVAAASRADATPSFKALVRAVLFA